MGGGQHAARRPCAACSSPTGRTSPSCSTRSSLACGEAASSPTSSRSRVPPSASPKRPGRARTAPVKAPRAWPKSSASASSAVSAAQLKRTKGSSARGEAAHQRLGHPLLAGAALAGDEHGDVARRHPGHQPGQRGASLARRRPWCATSASSPRQPLVLVAQPDRLDGPPHHRQQLVDLEGLLEVVVGAGLHGLDGVALRAVRGDEHHPRAPGLGRAAARPAAPARRAWACAGR